jgi:chromatin structure-remodeling complex subunit RSC1/2
MPQYTTPQQPSSYQQPVVRPPPLGYKAPQPVEVYILNDHANASIPPEIREQFQRDEQGRVLFFTAPPVVPPEEQKEGMALGHSARYLAAKAEREALRAAKRKAEEASAPQREAQAKKAKLEAEKQFQKDVAALKQKAFKVLEEQLARVTVREFEAMYADKKEAAKALEKQLDHLAEVQKAAIAKNEEREKKLREEMSRTVPIRGMTVHLEEKF